MGATSWFFSPPSCHKVREVRFLSELPLFTSLHGYSCLVRAWWMCASEWDTVRSSHILISHTFSAFASYVAANPSAVVMNLRLAIEWVGVVVRAKERKWEEGWGGALAAEVQTWPGCPKALTSSMWLTQGMNRRKAGRPTCCCCPGNIQRWSEGIHRHQLFSFFLPPSLSYFFPSLPPPPLFLSSISSFHSFLLSRTKPDHRHAADFMVAMVT